MATTQGIDNSNTHVLVTGGSGFVGVHCILQLLKAGYTVRTTVRSLKRETDVRAMLKAGGVEAGDKLSFVAADLSADDGWADAVSGCTYVLHVASPFPPNAPKHEDELIVPAREGTLRVLKAARDAGVKRVVLTSSFAAVGYGHKHMDRPFTEEDWTNPEAEGLSAYVKSKVLAERAAWDFMAKESGNMELNIINPVGIFGPALGSDYSSSVALLQGLMNGSLKAVPQITASIVDVRDVADLHLRAMTSTAKGERFLAVAGEPMTFPEVAKLIKAKMGSAAEKVSTKVLPNWLVKTLAIFKPELRQIVPQLGLKKRSSNEKARKMLGWKPRSNEEAIIASAESVAKFEQK